MKVTLAIDSLAPSLGGIGRYCWELCQRLPAQPGLNRLSFYRDGRLQPSPEVFLRARNRGTFADTTAWISRRLARRATGQRLMTDLFHSPNYFLPDKVSGGIITVHDLSVLKYPETHPAARIQQFERQFESSLARSAYVLTDTEHVKQELITELGLPAHKVRAVHLGVDARYGIRSGTDVDIALARYGLQQGGYGLCVSTLEPRKRIGDLIEAWSRLPSGLKRACPLVLAGQDGWLNDGLAPLLDRASTEGWMRWLGFVPEQDLPLLYSGARMFAYPSIYEGFGLPPLEAMASGVPVIVAAGTCLGEVCADAAAYVTPSDHAGFATAIEQCLVDEDRRAAMVAAGLERAAAFSWERCARQTAELYHEAWLART